MNVEEIRRSVTSGVGRTLTGWDQRLLRDPTPDDVGDYISGVVGGLTRCLACATAWAIRALQGRTVPCDAQAASELQALIDKIELAVWLEIRDAITREGGSEPKI